MCKRTQQCLEVVGREYCVCLYGALLKPVKLLATCKRTQQLSTTLGVVGHNLQHSVQTDSTTFGSCWPRILRLFVRSFIETGQTFSYMQTDATTLKTLGVVGQQYCVCLHGTLATSILKLSSPVQTDATFLPTTPNIVGCYMLGPFAHSVACCCVLLHNV